ncbi:GltI [Desulforapulum autotrophicum HRM2]|uniref:GltI n=1 Tax=Desulforapulum autotrophicum (strain ATCC 43914 / DSM 3382 / VKM B-1955 / HRM2) TaxID=177437 RepID=C0QE00_DESAH|nr:transporter substrate-binding domain-containing protein [Desulforapulum autotrophicum]ACN17421.1 GltI [Desulforapulum autotrophicum HRM2]
MEKMMGVAVAAFYSLAILLGITGNMDHAVAGDENLLEKIEKSGEVHMGFREGSVPFGFIDKNGSWDGFGIDLGTEVVKDLEKKFNKPIKLVKHPMNPKTRITMVTNGMVAMGIGSTTITLAREEVVDFSLPYFLTGTRLLVPKDSPISSFADIGGKRVGMGSGSTANIKGMDRAIEQGLVKPACKKVLFEEHNKGFLALQQGKIDAYFTDASQLAGMRAKARNPQDWKIVGKYLTYEPYGFILPEGQGEWRDFVNASLIHMIKDGRFEVLYTKWFGPDGVVPLPMTDEYKVLLKSLSYPE